MEKKIKNLLADFKKELEELKSLNDLEQIRVKYLGKKSEVLDLLKNMKDLESEQRKIVGQVVNTAKNEIAELIENKKAELEQQGSVNKAKMFDFTIDGKSFQKGSLHPITIVKNEIVEIFQKLGFGIAEGPDIESDYNNFTALNFPQEHPARDTQDTFFLTLKDKEENKPLLLRTHTSPVQIRYMKQNKAPFQIVIPGTVYRSDSDVSHTPMFHQVEGLAVGEDITFANLKWALTQFVHQMFGVETKLRFRPSFFPFTEPSVEIDISCVICKGQGCRVCKNTGWLEVLGAGMVHPNVLKNAGYDPENIQGFAFGMGVERIAMLKYEIDDIRLFYENDLRFLKQF